MDNRKELRELVEKLKKITGLGQNDLSIKVGYGEKYITQALSKKYGQDSVIKRLELVFAKELEKTTFYNGGSSKSEVREDEVPVFNGNFKEKYYQELEENNKLLKSLLVKHREELQRVNNSLNDALKNQLTIVSMVQAAADVALQKMSETPEEHRELVRNFYKSFSLKRSDYEKRGSLIEAHI